MKKIFVIDWILFFVFILSSFSGIGLHLAGHDMCNHPSWHNWAVFHIMASLLFLTATIFHVKAHWGWYKAIMKNGITAALSVLLLLVSATGIVLLGVNGANSSMGLLHYKIGIASIILSASHILNRIHILRQSLKSK